MKTYRNVRLCSEIKVINYLNNQVNECGGPKKSCLCASVAKLHLDFPFYFHSKFDLTTRNSLTSSKT